ncbi:MAG: hypothetical protein P8R36_05025, partial [Actinomycetota bacterium]|nr:hypothetical protein [Actinomycetota bacterium]
LKVLKPGRQLIDPQSGLLLGSTETEVGQIKVKETTSQFSIATMVVGSLPSAGDKARVVLSGQESKSSAPQRKRLGRKI